MKREYCTSETFRTDITELCEDCPLIDKIKTGIKNQIEFKILEQQSILIKELFSDYLRKEILDAQNAMSETQNIVSRGECTNLAGCIEVYIWNKERIKVLNQFYNEVKTPQQKKVVYVEKKGSLQETTRVYAGLNQALLAQYPFSQKPAVKAEHWLSYQGKIDETTFKPMPEILFKEFWERIIQAENNIRGDVLLLETPQKIPLFNILLDLLEDTIFLLKNEKNQYAEYLRDGAIELLEWLKTRVPKAKKPPEKKELTFKDLFNDPENAQKIKDILEQNHYTTKGKWQPNKQVYNEHSEMKTELLAVYYVLKEKEVLKVGKTTTQAKIFYKEFGLKVGEYISDRQLRERPNKDINKFENLFKRIE